VGRKLLRDRGRTASTLLALVEQDRKALAKVDHPAAHRVSDQLRQAVEAAQGATRALLEFGTDAPRSVYAGSVPYLNLLGTLGGGWMLARTLLAVLSAPRTASAEDAERRVQDAEFYAAHHLSQTAALSQAIRAGEVA